MTTWRKSSYSGSQADCVEVGGDSQGITIRDTKNRLNGPVLRVTPRDWARFTASVKR
ncbi:MAG: hypothetical protein JWM19_1919 [Actinomycetia bacterium]|nr:hypothetical protein [Actinomycetes bacterium]